MNVLAIDPSMRHWGVAILECDDIPLKWQPKKIILSETIHTEKKKSNIDDYMQFWAVAQTLRNLKDEYDPRFTVAEIPHGSRNQAGAKSLGICWGICASLCAVFVEASAVKRLIGSKKGDPDKKQKAVNYVGNHLDSRAFLWDVDEMEHIADAICAYYAYLKGNT